MNGAEVDLCLIDTASVSIKLNLAKFLERNELLDPFHNTHACDREMLTGSPLLTLYVTSSWLVRSRRRLRARYFIRTVLLVCNVLVRLLILLFSSPLGL